MINIFKYLKKKGEISGTVIAIILLVIAMALIVGLIIYAGRMGQGGITDLSQQVNVLRHGGA
ncbi:MAG TPA: hypothetical protein ENN30_02280 [Candidatus Woesearchaeota archaeon]|nr:hypothetical protein [Candidatus Woesearchaeota archaeon]